MLPEGTSPTHLGCTSLELPPPHSGKKKEVAKGANRNNKIPLRPYWTEVEEAKPRSEQQIGR